MSTEDPGRRSIRVLWLIRGLGPGGAEHLLVSAAKAHDRKRFEFEVAYLVPRKDALVPDLEAEGIRATCLNVRAPGDPRWIPRFARLLRHGRFDVVHIHSPIVAALGRPVARMFPSPRRRPAIIYTEHNRWTSYRPWTRRLNRATFRLNDAAFAVSSDTLLTIDESVRDSVEIAVQGIVLDDIEHWRLQRETVRTELGLRPQDIAVVTVANLRAQKAYPDLLEAARQVLAVRDDVVFLAIGQGPLEDEIRGLHRSLGLGDRFRLLGHQPGAVRLVGGCDVFVLASQYEGYPIAVMEALAMGLPVVATNVGGIPDAVEDGVAGLVVAPHSPSALAAALLKLVDDADLRQRFAEAAHRKGQQFGIDGVVRRTEAVYEEVVGRRGIYTALM